VSPEAEEALMTTAERLLAQGRAEGEVRGRAEGEVRGRAEGEVRGRAATLAKLLTVKFGPLPAHVESRLAQASLPELELWTERVLTATTLDAVFESPR
jgi:hypothetical protein